MTIEKRSNGKYRVTQMIDGKRYRVTLDHRPTKKEAEEAIRELMQSRSPVRSKDSFEKCAREYMAARANVCSPATIRGYDIILRHLSEQFKNYPLCEIEQIHVQREINDYAATRSAKSVKNAHGFIASVIKVFNPSLSLHTKLPQKEKYEPIIPTDEEVKAVLDNSKDTRYYIVFLLASLGLRRSEICALKVSDLSEDNRLHIHRAKVLDQENKWTIKEIPKTYESNRIIRIPDMLAELIRDPDSEYIYEGEPGKILEYLHRTQNKLSVPLFDLHSFRKYYASAAHAMGIPDKYIMEYGGWSTDAVLKDVYMRTMRDKQDDMQQKTIDHINKLIK